MIKANELRIGNIVKSNVGNPESNDWVIIELHHLIHIHDGNYLGYEPIPLTEEWLLKFGFKEVSCDKFFKDDFAVYFGWYEQISIYNDDQFLRNLIYIHQLQNLYFALTGEELTINPE